MRKIKIGKLSTRRLARRAFKSLGEPTNVDFLLAKDRLLSRSRKTVEESLCKGNTRRMTEDGEREKIMDYDGRKRNERGTRYPFSRDV